MAVIQPDSLPTRLYLASASPRRCQLLRQIGVNFQVIDHAADELPRAGEVPEALATRLSRNKARSALDRLPADARAVVLGADTVVDCAGQVLGKPRDRRDALRMLRLLSGQVHQVHSAVSLLSRAQEATILSSTVVQFRELDEQEIQAYWRTGEPRDKAGAYAIQGLGAVFVTSIQGSYSGVVGLPLAETAGLLQQFGVLLWQAATVPGNEQQ